MEFYDSFQQALTDWLQEPLISKQDGDMKIGEMQLKENPFPHKKLTRYLTLQISNMNPLISAKLPLATGTKKPYKNMKNDTLAIRKFRRNHALLFRIIELTLAGIWNLLKLPFHLLHQLIQARFFLNLGRSTFMKPLVKGTPFLLVELVPVKAKL